MGIKKILPYVLAFGMCLLLIWIIFNQIEEYRLQDDPMLYTLREILIPVHPIFKDIKLYKGDKSYTINKEKTFLCLYDENGDYYPINMLVHVLIHEIAHSLNKKDIGHTEEFHRIFEELLQKATELGVYNPSIPLIQGYCNHD
jgi:hypothetical protein